jgi:hypothetical protein
VGSLQTAANDESHDTQFRGAVQKTGDYKMNLEKLTKRVTEELETSLSADLPAAERKQILDIVQRAMLDSATRTHRELKETAVVCCGPEADLAHKIQEQMDNKRDMLVANLKAMW